MPKKKVVIIGGEHAQWPLTNAEWFARAGFDAQVLFFSDRSPVVTPENFSLIQKPIQYSIIEKIIIAAWVICSGILALLCWPYFRAKTGRNPMIADLCISNNPITARKKTKIINELTPDIIVGHNISLSGLTVALSKVRKKILIGWSGDMSEAFHVSPIQYQTCKFIIARTDLFIAASETALHIFSEEFSIQQKHLLRTAWQDKRIAKLLNYDHSNREQIRETYDIPAHAKVIFHARRFKLHYWAMQGMDACIEVARRDPHTRFVFIEGIGNRKYFQRAINKLDKQPNSISDRFIMLRGEVSLQTVLNLFSISDIFLSLRKRGDMRSASVIQGAAMGSIPVLPVYTEWKIMKENGFDAFLVDPDNPESLVATILEAIESNKDVIAQKNRNYLEKHESDEVYFERFSTSLRSLADQ